MKEKISYKKEFVKGIFAENPVFVSLLGMCPTLATTKSLEAAFGMGLLVLITLCFSNLIISLLRKIIPQEVKIPAYIVIIASLVTIVKMFTEAFLPDLYNSLVVFISLIVVNCIILGRAEAFASKHGPLASIMDALGMGLGFTMALCIMGIIRELLGTGGLTFGTYFPFLANNGEPRSFIFAADYAIKLFVQPTGGFLTLGVILAVIACFKNKKQDKLEAINKAKKLKELEEKKKAMLAQKETK